MRIALVHDYLIQYGGAERVLESLCHLFPEAPIYTLLYDRGNTGAAFEGRKIYTSFLQKAPLAKSHHRSFLMLMPITVEQFDFSKYDLIISDSHSYAKGVIIPSHARHICYCHTPIRYAWDDCHKYIEDFRYPGLIKKFIPFLMNYIRLWDEQSVQGVDRFIANSRFVSQRIKKYYRRSSRVIYPPVKTKFFYAVKKPADYFLMVGRFLPYKHFSLAIKVFNELGWPLKIIGDGPEAEKLKKQARSNIEFVGLVSESQLRNYYAYCQALIFPQEEDFGIVAVEAMASGRPVIAYGAGGALEIIEPGITGLFFREQTPASLKKTLLSFEPSRFDSFLIKEKAARFDEENFRSHMRDFINSFYKT